MTPSRSPRSPAPLLKTWPSSTTRKAALSEIKTEQLPRSAYLGLRENERAFAALEKGFQTRDTNMIYLKTSTTCAQTSDLLTYCGV